MTRIKQHKHEAARREVERLNGRDVLPPYCTAEVSRHGKVCVYFRMVGRTSRVRMRAEPGSAEFYADYARLRLGDTPPVAKPARSESKPKTWRWLCEHYFHSMNFRRLAPDGQRLRRRLLEATYLEPIATGSSHLFGDFPLDQFSALAVGVLRNRKVKMVTDENGDQVDSNLGAANSRLKYIRAVLKFGAANYPALVTRNWAKDVDYLEYASEGFPTWSRDAIEQFEKHHPVGSKARLTMALAYYTGQRRGDIARLGRIAENNGFLRFVQEKNHRKEPVTAHVPIVPPLRAIIDASETGDLFYIVKGNGQPYRKESLGNLFKKWCVEAGLPNLSLHGLRKACVIRMIEDDCSHHEIMSLTGHRTLKEIDRYAREYMRGKAAESVLAKWLAKHAIAGS